MSETSKQQEPGRVSVPVEHDVMRALIAFIWVFVLPIILHLYYPGTWGHTTTTLFEGWLYYLSANTLILITIAFFGAGIISAIALIRMFIKWEWHV